MSVRRWLVIGATLALGITACGGGAEETGEPTDSEEPITIGHVYGATGWATHPEVSVNEMVRLAVEDINETGGVLGRPLEVITYDQKSDPEQTVNGVLELLSKGAEVIIVPGDFDLSAAGMQVAQEQQVVTFAPEAGDPKIGKIGPYAFGMGQGTNLQAAAMAEYAVKELGLKNAYVLIDQTIEYSKTLGQYFLDRFPEVGGTVVGQDTFLNDDPSIAGQITRMQNASPAPDFIFLASYVPGSPSAVRQIRAAGIDAPILAGLGAGDGEQWLEAVPGLSDMYYPAYGFIWGAENPDPIEGVNEVLRAYEETYGHPLDNTHALTGYAVVQVIAQAIETAGSTDGPAIQKALVGTPFDTIFGEITYTEDFHMPVTVPLRINAIQNGEQTFVELWTVEKAPPVRG